MPQRIRHRVVFLSFLTAVLLYLDRFVLSYVERLIKLDLGLSENQISWGLSAFFWSYALAQVPSGLLTDRYGPRRMLTIYILLWSAGTALMGWVNGFGMLIAVRLGIGLAQAGAYPTCAAIVGRWVPLTHRGRASSLIAIGGRIGGGIAPILTAFLVMVFAIQRQSPAVTSSDVINPEPIREAMVVGTPSRPPNDAALLELVNQQINGPLMQARMPPDQPVEREVERILKLDTPTPAEIQVANRLILEAAFPNCIRPFYANGWRPVMWTYGLAGILIAALYWFVVRDWPAQHPRVSSEELAEIDAGRPAQSAVASQARPPLPLRAMLASRSLWLISGSQFFTNVAWTFLVLQLPRYLQEAHHLSFADRSLYSSIPLWCGWGGMFLGGVVTDWCVRRFGLRLGRVVPLVGSRLLGTLAFLGLLLEPQLNVAMILLSLVAIAADFASPATWAFNQDIGGRFIASTLGWGNMWGNIGSALSPLLLTAALTASGNWSGPFLLCTCTFAASGLCTLFVDPHQSIDPHSPAP